MSQNCRAKTKRGAPCRAAVVHGTTFCPLHGDPGKAAELGRMGGRKNRHYVEPDLPTLSPPSTPEEVKTMLAQAVVDVRMKKLDPRLASALTSMCGVLLKAMETTDLEQRIRQLEGSGPLREYR
jgi:hypothetical protein